VEKAGLKSDDNLIAPRPNAVVGRPAGKAAGLLVDLDCVLGGKRRHGNHRYGNHGRQDEKHERHQTPHRPPNPAHLTSNARTSLNQFQLTPVFVDFNQRLVRIAEKS
jgi:hypothetical protein